MYYILINILKKFKIYENFQIYRIIFDYKHTNFKYFLLECLKTNLLRY